jgi:hypothetical protein
VVIEYLPFGPSFPAERNQNGMADNNSTINESTGKILLKNVKLPLTPAM